MAHPSSDRDARAGFTAVEMLVTLLILTLVIVFTLNLFDLNTRLGRVQADVSDMQQNVRFAQLELLRNVRMAGRGGMPAGNLPLGLAVSVANDVPAGTFVDPGNTHRVVAGTDVLTVRGVISTPVYMVLPGSYTFNGATGRGSFVLANTARPGLSIPQSLDPIRDAISAGRPEALVLVSPLDDAIYHVVELDPGTSTDLGGGTSVQVGFRISGGTHTTAYNALSGGAWDPALDTDVDRVGILEELRYYVSDERLVAADAGSDPKPKLTLARTFPGTQTPHGGAADWHVVVADNVADLQVALGIDTADAVTTPDGVIVEAGNETDEWLYNHPDDDDTEARWQGTAANPSRLFYVRVNTVAITDRRDRTYSAPDPSRIEDHVYGAAELLAAPEGRQYRRRNLQTIIDLRNLS